MISAITSWGSEYMGNPITDSAVILEEATSSRHQKWDFDTINSYALVSGTLNGISCRLLWLNLSDGGSAEIEIAEGISMLYKWYTN